ncbi:MAG: PilT/PilU family type 4a pilus ATPase [bacterium]|nr:PilT/PilU family type 4a pilus ATPase [bacterium]
MYNFIKLLEIMNDKDVNATDLHIKVGLKPAYRINKQLVFFGNEVVSYENIIQILKENFDTRYLKELETTGSFDYGISVSNIRFRINVFKTQGAIGISARKILEPPENFESLNLPLELIIRIIEKQKGLILISGTAGSGKTTTASAIIQYINSNYSKRIVTIEDPIEYVFTDRKCFITQREIGIDTISFERGLRDALRQDPDIIFLGELRDYQSAWIAINAAETGHMVITTLHSDSTIKTIYRIMDMFKEEQREVAKEALMNSLNAIICQKLVNSIKTSKLMPVVEIMVSTPTIKGLIRDNEILKIYDYILNGEYDGMITFGKSLRKLVEEGHLSRKVAITLTEHPEELHHVEENRGSIW